MATIIDELLVSLGFDADTSGAEKYNEKLGDVLGTVTKVGAAVVGAGALISGFLGKSLLDTASQFENFETQLTTIEGSSAKARESLDWIADFAKKTPYDMAGVTEAFVKLKAFGLDPINGNLLESLGNTASAMGKTLDQSVEMIADAVRGESERLKEFGIVGSKGKGEITYSYTLNGESLEKTVKDDSIEIQKALQEIFDSKFAGGMEAMSKTWDGLVAKMGDTWSSFKRRITERGAFDRLKGYLENLNRTIDDNADAIDDFADKVGDKLVVAFEWLEQSLFKVWDGALWVRDAFNELDKQLGLSNKSGSVLAGVLALIAANMVGFAALKTVSEIASLASAFMSLFSPLALVGALLIAFALVVHDIYGFMNGKDSLIGSLIKDYPVIGEVLDLIFVLIDTVKRVWTENQGALSALWDSILALATAFKPVLDLLIHILPLNFKLLAEAGVVAIEVISVAIQILAKTLTLFIKIFTFLFSGLWKSLGGDFDGFIDRSMFKMRAFLELISGVAKTIRLLMDGDFKDAFNTLKDVGFKANSKIWGFGQYSYENSGKSAVKAKNGGGFATNQSTVTQHINVASANEAAIVANRTAQGTRQQSYGYQ